MTLRQLPDFAFRSLTDYANEMAKMHDRYDASMGVAVVDALERLQLFHVFKSTWFSAGLSILVISIVACTIDRLPRLWKQSSEIRVIQPDPFFDPKLPDRAAIAGMPGAGVTGVLRKHGFRVREAEHDGVRYLYGDRNRWTKLATLSTHTGLVLFLVAAATTFLLGDEQGLVVAEGESLTVQPIGTPGLLLVKNHDFEAPGFLTGTPTDFTTDLSVYQNGQEIARKTIRVNDPLSVGGYTFHQNGFGPAPDLLIRDQSGQALWSGPVPMTDEAAGFPFTELVVPGRDVALQLLLQRRSDGLGVVLVLPFRITGTNPDGTQQVQALEPLALARGESAVSEGTDFSVELRQFSEFTLLIAKKDPGQGLVWLAFGFLIVGIAVTFWMPRRRVWARLDPEGKLAMTWRSDRYVDVIGEFGRLLDDLVRLRRAGDGGTGTAAAAPSATPGGAPPA
jgi:cytochrome c biogenesis protein